MNDKRGGEDNLHLHFTKMDSIEERLRVSKLVNAHAHRFARARRIVDEEDKERVQIHKM